MLHIVAYDIRNPKRLKKIAKLCLDYGVRVQFSIFEFDLEPSLTMQFIREIDSIIDPRSDKVMIIPVCSSCRKNIRLLGQATPFSLPDFYCF